jgi:hypothetical protein
MLLLAGSLSPQIEGDWPPSPDLEIDLGAPRRILPGDVIAAELPFLTYCVVGRDVLGNRLPSALLEEANHPSDCHGSTDHEPAG